MEYKPSNPRYKRQTTLKEFGEHGQKKLSQAKVLVVGAGGLGCPVLQYLTAAGVGTIGIVDHDIISLHNLHRQVLYSTDDVGLDKASRAAEILSAMNPEIDLKVHSLLLTTNNAADIISQYDLVVDGTDNFATRYMINDCCVLLGKTLVYGAISKFEGQIAVFNFRKADGSLTSNYRDIFPVPPEENEIENCEQGGVIGILPGIIGSMMANEVIKMITGIGHIASDELVTYNSLSSELYTFQIAPKAITGTFIPTTVASFRKKEYALVCSSPPVNEISADTFENWIGNDQISFVDVREPGEIPVIDEFDHMKIPLSRLTAKMDAIMSERVVLFCQSGKRSITAAKLISERFGDNKIVYSLTGGIVSWTNSRK